MILRQLLINDTVLNDSTYDTDNCVNDSTYDTETTVLMTVLMLLRQLC